METTNQETVNGRPLVSKVEIDGHISASHLSLYGIETALLELSQIRDEAETDEEREVIDQQIIGYVNAELQKVDRIRTFIQHCKTMAQAARDEAALQSRRAAAWDSRVERIQQICLDAMQAHNLTRIEGRSGSISLRPNGGKLPLVIDDEKALPSIYSPMEITYTVDKEQLRKDLEDGKKVPGAHLAERGRHLSVT